MKGGRKGKQKHFLAEARRTQREISFNKVGKIESIELSEFIFAIL